LNTDFLSPAGERIEVRGRSLFDKTEGRSKGVKGAKAE